MRKNRSLYIITYNAIVMADNHNTDMITCFFKINKIKLHALEKKIVTDYILQEALSIILILNSTAQCEQGIYIIYIIYM